ncbi:hypothetical protein MTR_4g021200 [Medicago truncatula]|uniref:Uncharacterized protein n=1 Tax=Medicago truncatula TaxID=3880 RepID=G7JTD1_MEDTR|nr:hypothetical protein MTR_4g021200 [Medicago truncatula]
MSHHLHSISNRKESNPCTGWSFKIGGPTHPLISYLPQFVWPKKKKIHLIINVLEIVALSKLRNVDQVCKGMLPDSKAEVAIKRVSHESKQGLR